MRLRRLPPISGFLTSAWATRRHCRSPGRTIVTACQPDRRNDHASFKTDNRRCNCRHARGRRRYQHGTSPRADRWRRRRGGQPWIRIPRRAGGTRSAGGTHRPHGSRRESGSQQHTATRHEFFQFVGWILLVLVVFVLRRLEFLLLQLVRRSLAPAEGCYRGIDMGLPLLEMLLQVLPQVAQNIADQADQEHPQCGCDQT